jgi:hypothetical protein
MCGLDEQDARPQPPLPAARFELLEHIVDKRQFLKDETNEDLSEFFRPEVPTSRTRDRNRLQRALTSAGLFYSEAPRA